MENKKRICLINPVWGSHRAITFAPPMGLMYIASSLEKNGFSVKIIDRIEQYYKKPGINLNYIDEITKREILDFSPHYIGITATTIQMYDMIHVAHLCRELPEGAKYIIIAGGCHPTAEPEMTLKEIPEINIVCRGEGENTMLDIVQGEDIRRISGITYRYQGRIYSNPDRELIKNIDVLPFPAYHLVNMNFYTDRKRANNPALPLRTLAIITSRGCPYRCKFCASNCVSKKVRLHSWQYVVQLVENLMNRYFFEEITFFDDMFLTDKKRVEKICEYFIQNKIYNRITWSCSARVDAVDDKILKLMKKAGCCYIIYGLESGSQKMLDLMNKKTTVGQNRRAVKLANKVGIKVNSAFIVNLPGEDEEDFLATLEFIKRNKIYTANLNNLMPLPGSPYYDELIKSGKLKFDNQYDLWVKIGALPEYVEHVRDFPLYSNIEKARFWELWEEGWKILEFKNNLNYIKANWFRMPLLCIRKLFFLVVLFVLGGRNSIFYSVCQKFYKYLKNFIAGMKKIIYVKKTCKCNTEKFLGK